MHSSKFIKQVIREAKKSSVMQAARKFAVAYTTVKKWLNQDLGKKEQQQKYSHVQRPALIETEIPSELSNNKIVSKSTLFLKHCASLQPFAQVAVKYIQLNCTNKLPKWLIVAYDLKTGGLNLCFTSENNKSNKALYLLYINSFLQEKGNLVSSFISELQLDGINTHVETEFDRLILSHIKRALNPLISLLNNTLDIPELLTKSYIFLVDYNLTKKTDLYLHPPFVLDNNLTTFDFVNNTLMLKGLNEKVRSDILKITCEYHQHEHQLSEFSNERLLTINDYFIKHGMKNRYLEEKIVQDAANLQLMGELSRSELLLKSLLKNKELTADGRNALYLTYGQQKFHSGDYPSALRYYKKTVAGCKLTGNPQLEFTALRNMCTFWLYQDKDNKAYRYLRLAQRAAVKSGEDHLLARYYFLSGHYYCVRGEYKYSVQELEHAVFYSKQHPDSEEYPRIAYALANSLVYLKKYKEGLKFALQALSFFLKSGQKIPICVCYRTCAECNFAFGNTVEAEKNLRTALILLNDLNYPVVEFTIRELYTRMLLSCKRESEAKQQFAWLESFVAINNDNPEVLKIYKVVEQKMNKFSRDIDVNQS